MIDMENPIRVAVDSAQPVPDEWPELLPLGSEIAPEPYPLDALPVTLKAAVQEVAGFVKAPASMIVTSALAAISLAVQAHHDVARADRLVGPCALFLLVVADSGERKSTCDGFFTQAIRDYEQAQREAMRPALQAWRSERDAWDAKRAGVKEKIKQLAKEGKATAAQERELQELDGDEPKQLRVPRLIYGDATPEALTYALATGWPSAGVVSSEAGNVLGSHGMGRESVMRNLATLNVLWEGAAVTVDRRTSDSYTVRGARLTMALQVQEATLRSFFEHSKGLARGTGFLARFLVAWPESTQGTRFFTEAPPHWPALASFNQRLSGILSRPVPIDTNGALEPQLLVLSPEAKAAWVSFHDHIEAMLCSGGALQEVRDVASKTADNAARLAALLHVFEGGCGPISVDAMAVGARIAAWHLNEARRFFGELAQKADQAHLSTLQAWLLVQCARIGCPEVPTRDVLNSGPYAMRQKAVLEAAVLELQALGRVRLRQDGKRKVIQVHPQLLSSHAKGGAL